MFRKKYQDHMNCQQPSQQAIDQTKEKMNHKSSAVKFTSTKMQRIIAFAVVIVMLTTSVALATMLNRHEDYLTPPSRPNDIVSVGDFSEIYALIRQLQSDDDLMYGGSGGGNRFPGAAPGGDGNSAGSDSNDSSADMEINAPGDIPQSGGGGSDTPDFSDTNLQVLGVQEADIVKTDGFHIYAVSNTQISIIAVNDGDLELLWQIPRFSENQTRVSNTFEIFITPGRLILMSNAWDEPHRQNSNDANDSDPWDNWHPWWGWNINQGVIAEIYDVSDMSRPPVRLGEVGQSGSYVSSRMIGETLYLATNHSSWYEQIDSTRPETFVPHVIENGEFRTVNPENIVHTGGISRIQYTVVSGIDTSGSGSIIGTQALMDMGWTVYSSHNNVFITATQWLHERGDEDNTSVNYQVTNLTRISLNNGDVRVEASAEVDGWVLNQFAMDEFDGTFRIITSQRRDYFTRERYFGSTEGMDGWYENDHRGRRFWRVSHWSGETEIEEGIFQWVSYRSSWEDPSIVYRETNTEVSTNNVFVLDMDLNTIGSIQGLAPGERVFSVRFMSEIAFFVTFRDTDPLFAVDFNDPTNPVILSELKIPGFSDYLHPFGAGRLFGFGRYVCEDTGIWGDLRISMFNTDDLADVYKRHYHDLTGFWWSEANHNHRAILVCPRRNLIGFQTDSSYLIYGYCDENGFFRRGEIRFDDHCPIFGSRWSWWGNMRGLYIGDYFYVITGNRVASFCLETFQQVDYVILEEEQDFSNFPTPRPPFGGWDGNDDSWDWDSNDINDVETDYEWEAMTFEEKVEWSLFNRHHSNNSFAEEIWVVNPIAENVALVFFTTQCEKFVTALFGIESNDPPRFVNSTSLIAPFETFTGPHMGFWHFFGAFEHRVMYSIFLRSNDLEYLIINGDRVELNHFEVEHDSETYHLSFWYIFVDSHDTPIVFG